MIGCTSTGRSAPTSRPICRVCAPAATTIRCASIGPRLVLTRNVRRATGRMPSTRVCSDRRAPNCSRRAQEGGRHQQRVGEPLARTVARAEQLRRQRRFERQHLAGRHHARVQSDRALVRRPSPADRPARPRSRRPSARLSAARRGRRPAPPPGSPTPAPRPRTAGSRRRKMPAAPRPWGAPGTGSGSARRGSGCAASRRSRPRPRGSARRAPPPARRHERRAR